MKMQIIQCQSSIAAQKKAKLFFQSKQDYQDQLLKVQTDLLRLQQKIIKKKQKMIVVLEGSDTAGKGGLVRRMAEHIDPRFFHVYGTSKPTTEELTQHYLQRFFARLPSSGEITVFDRSWYGRVLVERVEGFAKRPEWQRAYNEINNIEKILTADGILIVKYLLDISRKEQGERFKAREQDPLKSWKMTPDDYRNRRKWGAYQLAFRDMIKRTSTPYCPWKVIPADSKWFARVNILKDIVERSKNL